MRKKLIISCNEATTICDKNQYGEASPWDNLRLNFHLLLCKHCKTYSKQNNIITKVLGNYLDASDDSSKCLSSNEKQFLEKKLNEELDK